MLDVENIRKWFASEVKERMKETGLKPGHISYKCYIRSDNIHEYLVGKPFPRLWNLVLMAECLECSVNDLLGFDDTGDTDIFEKYLASKMYLDEYDFARHFSTRVLRVMNDRGFTAYDLHRETGFSESLIARWTTNKTLELPTVLQLLHICDTLDCTPSDLLGY